MAFSFGSSAPASKASTGFGFSSGTGGGFGGSTGFGATSTSGSLFGSTAATSKPSTFGGFGTTTSSAPSFGFGAASQPGTQSTFGGGFGGAQTNTSNFSFNSNLNKTSTAPSFGFGGASGATGPSFGGFGTTTSKPLGFGTSTTSTFGAPSFGGFGSSGQSFGQGNTFGQGTGGLFSSQTTNQPAFGGGSGMFGGFNAQQQQQQQQQQAVSPVEQLYNAVLQCSVFGGDERDALLARWNMLQASWGLGKAFYSQAFPPLNITPENPLCRFKTIGYSAMPHNKNEDGLISATVKKKASEVQAQRDQVVTSIQGILGNKPNVQVVIVEIRSAGADTCEIVFHVTEKNQQTGQMRKIPADEMGAFFSQPMQVQNLQKIGFENVQPRIAFTQDQIKDYLDQPPQGIDPRLWKQAQLDNPDPKKLIPVPMIGFKALQHRMLCQDQMARRYKAKLNAIGDEISDLQKRHEDTMAKLRDAKRRQQALSHRVLHVLVKQEETRKIGFTIQPEEEKLRIQLEALQAEMSAPTQFKGRLNELLAKVRLQSQAAISCGSSGHSEVKTILDPFVQEDIKSILRQQQTGIQALVSLIKEDIEDLNLMTEQIALDAKDKPRLY